MSLVNQLHVLSRLVDVLSLAVLEGRMGDAEVEVQRLENESHRICRVIRAQTKTMLPRPHISGAALGAVLTERLALRGNGGVDPAGVREAFERVSKELKLGKGGMDLDELRKWSVHLSAQALLAAEMCFGG